MQLHANIVSNKVNTLSAVLKKIRPKANKNMYSWADSLFFTLIISSSLLHTLKAIIACMGIDRPTLAQINAARTRSASRKFAQSDPISERTLRRHIRLLELLGLITVIRSRDTNRNSRNAYTVMFPEEALSCPSQDIVSPSICTHDHNIINNTKSDYLKKNLDNKLGVGFNEIELALLATMLSWTTSRWVAVGWIRKYTADQLQGGIDYMDKKNIDHDNRGGYMRSILDSLDKRKAQMENKSKHTPAAISYAVTETDIYLNKMGNIKRGNPELAKAELAKAKEQLKKGK